MTTIEEISIQDMLEHIFTTVSVRKKRKDIVSYYLQHFGIDLFGERENDNISITEEEIRKRVDQILKEDKNSSDPFLSYSNAYYHKAKKKSKPIDTANICVDNNYMGKAGECAVMAELLFRGYNVNHMLVDEGIDLVASKNNVFYYIQVKTKNVDRKNCFYFQIKQERFDTFVGTQIRYYLVARCNFNNEERNIFFMFSNNDIMRLMQQSVIPSPFSGNGNLSLKIQYDERTGKAYMYDGKNTQDVTFHMNNFNL